MAPLVGLRADRRRRPYRGIEVRRHRREAHPTPERSSCRAPSTAGASTTCTGPAGASSPSDPAAVDLDADHERPGSRSIGGQRRRRRRRRPGLRPLVRRTRRHRRPAATRLPPLRHRRLARRRRRAHRPPANPAGRTSPPDKEHSCEACQRRRPRGRSSSATRSPTSPPHPTGASALTRWPSTTSGTTFRDVRRRHHRGDRTARRGRAAEPRPPPPPGVRHRPQLPQPRRGVRRGPPGGPDRVHQVPRQPRGALRRHRGRRATPATGRSSWSSSSAGPPTGSAEADAWCAHRRCSPSARTSATGTSSSRPAASSPWASPGAATGRSARGSSRRTSWTTLTTSPSDARSTARRCRTARTTDLIFNVPQLVAELSAVLPLLPGDVVFTGTPAGVGVARQPAALPAARRHPRYVDRRHRHVAQPHRGGPVSGGGDRSRG